MQPDSLRVRLVVPGNVLHNSGGNVYNAALARELAVLGVEVQTCPLGGGWPVGSAEDRRRLGELLCNDGADGDAGEADNRLDASNPVGHAGGATGDSVNGQDARPRRTITLVDGLLGCGAPEQLAAAAATGHPAWILLHMPLDDTGHDETGLEGRALRAAAGVICTSGSAAARIRARHGMEGLRVALPGTDAAALASGSEPPHFLAVAALLPNKDQLLLLAALSALLDLPWTASLIGSDTADPRYAARVRDTVERRGLQDRVRVPGELRGGALEAEWTAADLSLLISQAETYGLVVTESIARGVPVVVRAGTGAVEALAAGAPAAGPSQEPPPGTSPAPFGPTLPGTAVVLEEDPAPLAEVLRRWLGDPGVRTRWRAAATDARGRLPGWDATARTVLEALDPEGPADPPPTAPENPAAEDSPAAQAGGQ
ncbi:MAG TPA: glycosyltransferase [Arthrobacter sp.]|nr:glycosyltransferase [Arthrobacter sp.]